MPPKKAPPGISPGTSKPVLAPVAPEGHTDAQTIKNAIAEAIAPFVTQMKLMNSKLDTLQKDVLNIQGNIHKLETDGAETKLRMSNSEKQITTTVHKQEMLENQVIALQLEKSKYLLRFQNVDELPNEVTKNVMSELLSPFVKIPKDAVAEQIESAYRTSSFYIKKNNLQREILVKLTNKKFRDIILECAKEKQLLQGSNKIRILKDTPYLLRIKRRKYKKLAALLLKRRIKYIWSNTEGLLFKFKEKDYKITSEEKLKKFLDCHGEELETESLTASEVSSGELESEEGEGEEELDKKGAAAPKKKVTRGTVKKKV